jgi:hypothetical protein
MELWVWVVIVVVIVAYHLGYRAGVRAGVLDANKTAVQAGAWVTVVEPVAFVDFGTKRVLPVGVEGIVTARNSADQLTLWLAEPWVSRCRIGWVVIFVPASAVRAKPMSIVDPTIRDTTLAACVDFHEKSYAIQSGLVPSGFLDVQRILNRK